MRDSGLLLKQYNLLSIGIQKSTAYTEQWSSSLRACKAWECALESVSNELFRISHWDWVKAQEHMTDVFLSRFYNSHVVSASCCASVHLIRCWFESDVPSCFVEELVLSMVTLQVVVMSTDLTHEKSVWCHKNKHYNYIILWSDITCFKLRLFPNFSLLAAGHSPSHASTGSGFAFRVQGVVQFPLIRIGLPFLREFFVYLHFGLFPGMHILLLGSDTRRIFRRPSSTETVKITAPWRETGSRCCCCVVFNLVGHCFLPFFSHSPLLGCRLMPSIQQFGWPGWLTRP